jgi:hypothetical protein
MKEYKIRLHYLEIIENPETKIITVEAQNDEEAFDKAVDALYEEYDDEEVDDIQYEILSVHSTEAGCRDDRTIEMFEKETKNVNN